MGQESSAPANTAHEDGTTERSRPRHWHRQRQQRHSVQSGTDPLEGLEEKRPRMPTLREQWQAKREANALSQEANATERRRKKEALHAALVAQQTNAEKEGKNMKGSASTNGGDEEDAEELRLRQAAAEAEAALTKAQVSAQLAVLQALFDNNPDVQELEEVDGHPATLFDNGAASKAAQRTLKGKGCGSKNAVTNDDGDEIDEEVSVHTSDFEDEELLQGLDDLDEELEAEFQQRVVSLQELVEQHKQESLACLRERSDKAAALQELQKAKAIEAQIKSLLDSHEEPIRVQIEKQERRISDFEELVATCKQESLAALRSGDKQTALEKLKESKGFQCQLDEATAKLVDLKEEKTRQLHRTGEN